MPKERTAPQGFEEGDAPAIDLHPVESSQVSKVGYDEATQTLAVQFKHGTGAIYHYPGVTPKQHEAFVGAESIGGHFGKHIKPLSFKKYAPPKIGEKA
jgi:hypothetical protein